MLRIMNFFSVPFPQVLLLAVQLTLALFFGLRLAGRLHSQRAQRWTWAGVYSLALFVSFQAMALTACGLYVPRNP